MYYFLKDKRHFQKSLTLPPPASVSLVTHITVLPGANPGFHLKDRSSLGGGGRRSHFLMRNFYILSLPQLLTCMS